MISIRHGNLTKTILTLVVGVLSLSTTAFAGFKAYNKTVSAKEDKVSPTVTPETVELIQRVDQVEIIPNTSQATNPPSQLSISSKSTLSTNITDNQSVNMQSPKPKRFEDDDDDLVEFEENDHEDSDSKEDEDDD